MSFQEAFVLGMSLMVFITVLFNFLGEYEEKKKKEYLDSII